MSLLYQLRFSCDDDILFFSRVRRAAINFLHDLYNEIFFPPLVAYLITIHDTLPENFYEEGTLLTVNNTLKIR